MENYLLGALPQSDFNRLMPYLELVFMPTGHELYVLGMNLRYVYFPTTAVVSLFYILESGATAVIAIVGNEGIVGVCSFMGGHSTPGNAIVQNVGFGYRLKVQHLKNEFNRVGKSE